MDIRLLGILAAQTLFFMQMLSLMAKLVKKISIHWMTFFLTGFSLSSMIILWSVS